MELKKIIDDLIESGIIENQELGITLLSSPDVSDEEKRKHIEKYIKEYQNGTVDFFTEEQTNIFKGWVDIYLSNVKGELKNRIKKI